MHTVAVAVIRPIYWLGICFCYINKQRTNLINICHDNSTLPTHAWMMKRGYHHSGVHASGAPSFMYHTGTRASLCADWVQTGCPPTIWSPCNSSIASTAPPQLWMPNPLYPVSTAPFQLVLISGQISTCFGCRKGFMKPAVIPFSLVVKYKDNRRYTAPDGSPR